MKKRKNKKGQELTLGTILLIVIGVLVLVILIWGFSMGWGNFWSKISAFFGGGGNNVDSVKLACNLDCQPGSERAFCISKRSLKYEDSSGKMQKASLSCDEIRRGQYQSIVNLNSCQISFEECDKLKTSSITTK